MLINLIHYRFHKYGDLKILNVEDSINNLHLENICPILTQILIDTSWLLNLSKCDSVNIKINTKINNQSTELEAYNNARTDQVLTELRRFIYLDADEYKFKINEYYTVKIRLQLNFINLLDDNCNSKITTLAKITDCRTELGWLLLTKSLKLLGEDTFRQ